MSQELSQLSETPPLPGAVAIPNINKIIRTIATDFAGPDDPAAMAWPYCTWADTGNNLLKRRNAAGTAWVVEGVLFKASLPQYAEADIPLSDKGPIYVIGKGVYEWDGAVYSYVQTPSNVVTSPTVSSLNGGQLAGFRNKIINGAFQINQRGYVSGAATTAGQYTLDRWKVTGTGGITFATVNNKTTVTIPAGQTIQQVIEGLNLQSGDYVLSWEGTAQGRIGAGVYGNSGEVTATIVGGTDTTIEFNAGTVSNVQFELSTVATLFEHRHYGQELALCQRYFAKIRAFVSNTNQNIPLPVPLRTDLSAAVITGVGAGFTVADPSTDTLIIAAQTTPSGQSLRISVEL